MLDFNDLEHLTLQVLTVEEEDGTRVPSQAAGELSGQYEEILVDEYQDSNLVQETLIQSISRERLGQPNVFMVGDVKQSIYRFRLARPELFMEKYDTYSREESSHQMIELQQNFRSRASVLTCINDIFYQIMTKIWEASVIQKKRPFIRELRLKRQRKSGDPGPVSCGRYGNRSF